MTPANLDNANFEVVYARLNPEQKKAVDTTEGPVMVVAGPGTGKTQVLAARIANILRQTDTKPHNVLALTFTESAAKNMRERVVRMIGKTGYYVQISTFHSFCSDIIRSNPEFFPIDRGSEPLSDLERYDLFQSIILDLDLRAIKPMTMKLYYIRDIMGGVSNLKREGVSPEEFAKIVAQEAAAFEREKTELTKAVAKRRESNLKKQQELILVYEEYEKRLRAKLRYDFDDMIILVVRAFQEHELLLREYQEKLHYFLVDEYQDTNNAQNLVVDLLAGYWGEQANIFVVGDPHQAIYRFQGASVENMLGFIDKYRQALVVTLATGYRCFGAVYDAAYTSITHNELTSAEAFKIEQHQQTMEKALNKKLLSPKGQGEKIRVFDAPSQTVELIYVAEQIQKLIADNVPPEEIAVLFRHNQDVIELQEILEKWSIPYEIDGGANILEAEEIRQLLELFTVIDSVGQNEDSAKLFEVMCYQWLGLDRLLVMKVARAAGAGKLSIIDTVLAGYDHFQSQLEANGTSREEFARLELFVEKLMLWASQDAQLVFPQWFELVITESGYLDWILQHEAKIELLTNLNSLYREVKSLAGSKRRLRLRDFLETVEIMYEHKISLQAEDLNVTTGAVRLSTVHKAKGQEWEHVFIIHCLDGKWGNNHQRELLPLPEGLIKNTDLSKKELNEDERRLFYVAITRSKGTVQLSYPQTIVAGNSSKEVISSMFITEIEPEVERVSETETKQFLAASQESLARLLLPADTSTRSISEEEFFHKIVSTMPLSVTALNTYLRNLPEFVNNVLLKVPRAKPVPMAFGTAVHKALEEYFKHFQQHHAVMELADLQAIFAESLSRELINPEDFTRRLEYGQKILAAYHGQNNFENIRPLFIERFFGTGFSKTMLGDIRLTGRVDRVDWVDEASKTVRVIDYKTGSPKTVGFIEGKIKSAGLSEREELLPESIRGPYKRQLLFYKLLTDLDPTFIPTVTEGAFDFVEPDQNSGKLIQRQFTLSQSDVNDLKELIRTVMGEIRSLKFLENLESGS